MEANPLTLGQSDVKTLPERFMSYLSFFRFCAALIDPEILLVIPDKPSFKNDLQ